MIEAILKAFGLQRIPSTALTTNPRKLFLPRTTPRDWLQEGFLSWALCPPPYHQLLELSRDGWDVSAIDTKENIPADFNINGLYWRPARKIY